MNERRLLIAAEIFPPAIGGPATYAATLARELPVRGWTVAVMFYGDTVAGEYRATIVPVARRGGPVARYWRYFRTLWSLAKDFPVIYAQGPVSSGLPALIIAKLLRKKLVVKVTGDYAWEQAFRVGATKVFIEEFQRQRVGGKYGWLRFLEQVVCKSADVVVAPSDFLKTIVTGWGVPGAKIYVIYNTHDDVSPLASGEKTQLRAERLKVPADAFLVVSAGRAVPWKGFGVLGRVVTELIADGRNARLACIGVTDEQLRAMITQAGGTPLPAGDPRVRGFGVLDKTQVQAWLKAADCFALNTAYEGLSHLILEAISAGTPVITTNVGGNRELIQDGVTGIFVPYNDVEQWKRAIVALAENRAKYARFAADAVSFMVQRFSGTTMILNTERLLSSL